MGKDATEIEDNIQRILKARRILEELFGKSWIQEKNKEWEEIKIKSKPKDPRISYGYLRQKEPHPFIRIWNSKNPEDVAYLVSLAENLDTLRKGEEKRTVEGFDRILTDLKEDKFESTVFEALIAAGYAKFGYKIVLPPEGGEREGKNVDIEVKVNDETIYVECKKKSRITDRDRKVSHIWNEIRDHLLSYLSRKSKNYLIIVKFQSDPTNADIEYVEGLLKDYIDKSEEGRFADETKRFGFTLKMIAEKDEVIDDSGFRIETNESLDNVAMVGDFMVDDKKNPHYKNPKFIGFKCAIPPDFIKGVEKNFEKARKQIPQEERGLICIEVDNRSTINDLMAIEDIIKRKMKGQNRRINAVILVMQQYIKEKDYAALKWASKIIYNTNPKINLPKGFRMVGV